MSGNVVEGAEAEYGTTAVVVILMMCFELLKEQSLLKECLARREALHSHHVHAKARLQRNTLGLLASDKIGARKRCLTRLTRYTCSK